MLIDIIFVILILGGLLLGYKIGLLKIMGTLVSAIISFALALYVATPVTEFIYDATIKPAMVDVLSSKAEELGIETIVDTFYNAINSTEDSDIVLGIPELDLDSIVPVSDIPNLGTLIGDLPFDIENIIADTIELPAIAEFKDSIQIESTADTSKATTQVAEKLLETIAPAIIGLLTPFAVMLIYLIAHILFSIIFSLLFSMLKSIKFIDKVQRLGGLAAGGVTAILICLVIGFGCTVFAPDVINGSIASSVYTMASNALVEDSMTAIIEDENFEVPIKIVGNPDLVTPVVTNQTGWVEPEITTAPAKEANTEQTGWY